ncbi:hypothetical protein MKEN_00226700 [Mycena kentingensis (nom. inval.)]|nr:hypothetical protein MKEN_00226700 [Mycena kentingensis (nom. inval.)]
MDAMLLDDSSPGPSFDNFDHNLASYDYDYEPSFFPAAVPAPAPIYGQGNAYGKGKGNEIDSASPFALLATLSATIKRRRSEEEEDELEEARGPSLDLKAGTYRMEVDGETPSSPSDVFKRLRRDSDPDSGDSSSAAGQGASFSIPHRLDAEAIEREVNRALNDILDALTEEERRAARRVLEGLGAGEPTPEPVAITNDKLNLNPTRDDIVRSPSESRDLAAEDGVASPDKSENIPDDDDDTAGIFDDVVLEPARSRCPCTRCSPNESNDYSTSTEEQEDEVHRLFELGPFA